MKNKQLDAPELRVRVNDLLNDESQDSFQNLLDNLKQIGLKCKSAEITRSLISGVFVDNKLTSAYVTSVNQRILNMCQDNSFIFIGNNNVPTSSFFRDGLQLLENVKRFITNNFIDNLKIFFRNDKDAPTYTWISENASETTNVCKGNVEGDDKCCNASLKELRQKN